MIINGKEYTRENLGKIFDYAMLNHDVTREQVQEHVRKGIYYNVNGIHCNPVWVPMIADMLEGTGIETGICPAFPFGAADVEDKAHQAERMANILLDEFRGGKLGRITLELPQDLEREAGHDAAP